MDHTLRRFAGVLTAGLFVAYLIALPPHLVHHLFEEDHSHPACPYLATSQHTPGAEASPPSLPLPAEAAAVETPSASAWLPAPVLPVYFPRAPPVIALP